MAAQSLYSRLSDGSSFTFFSHDEFQPSNTFSLTRVPMGMSGAGGNEQAVTGIEGNGFLTLLLENGCPRNHIEGDRRRMKVATVDTTWLVLHI